MKHINLFESWVNEAITADQIADQIQAASADLGTDEDLLVSAIILIPDAASMVKVNQALKLGVETKGWIYSSIGDAINGELGMLDQTYKDRINTHIKNIRAEKYLGSFVAPPPPVDQIISSIRDRVIQHEGKKPVKYIDSKGIPTVGVGFNLTRSDSSELLKKVGANPDKIKSGKSALTDNQINALLGNDLLKAKNDAQTLASADGLTNLTKSWQKLPLQVQGVLTEMVFNLGKKGVSKFNNFLKYIAANNFAQASKEMLHSDWASQVGNRANTLSDIIKSA
jgi:lysozyme